MEDTDFSSTMPMGDEHGDRRIGNLVMERLFDRPPQLPTIGRYTVLDRIGQGGMGAVYAAYDTELDRKVALKVLSAGDHADESASLRLKREAQAMARLSHPNVATVHEVGQTEGRVYVAMEFIRGEDLEVWTRGGPPWREVLSVFTAAGRGIVAAHDVGLVHRDLKPHNIMRTDDGTVKVLDFGLARSHGETLSDDDLPPRTDDPAPLAVDLTRTGAVLGTPAYMSPEQFRGKPADARSDQFSFCVALYQGLYRQLPFAAPTVPAILARVLGGDIEPPPADSDVPAWVHRVVERGLQIEPDARWPTMRALLEALDRDPARARRRWGLVGALAVTTGLAGFGVARLGGSTPAAADDPCPEPMAERAALWAPERHERISRAFAASDNPIAVDTATRLGGPIGDYIDALGVMRAQACEAHRGGEQSARVHDLRVACLDTRRAGIDELLGAFERAEPATIDSALWAMASLPGVERCGDVEALTAAVAPPDDPEVATAVQGERERLASAVALALGGAHAEAIERIDAALPEVAALRYDPLRAEAELARGTVHMEARRFDPAAEALASAADLAVRTKHYEVAAEALARSLWVMAEPQGQPTAALALQPIAASMLVPLQKPPRLQWLLRNNEAVALFRDGQVQEAANAYREALAVVERVGRDVYPVQLISTRFNLALLLAEGLGRPDVAAGELRTALEQAVALLGPQHPRVFMLRSLRAENLSNAGQLGEAQHELEALREQLDRLDPYNQVLVLAELARVHDEQGRHDSALAVAEQALLLAEAQRDDPYLPTLALRHRGLARLGLGDTQAGLADLRESVRRTAPLVEQQPNLVAMAHLWMGLALDRAQRGPEALVEYERAAALVEAQGQAGRSMRARWSLPLVDAYLAAGQLDRAETTLTSVIAAQDDARFSAGSRYRFEAKQRQAALLFAQGRREESALAYAEACTGYASVDDPDHPELADCRLGYARALGRDDPRAREAAEQALASFRRLGPPFAAEARRARAVLNGL